MKDNTSMLTLDENQNSTYYHECLINSCFVYTRSLINICALVLLGACIAMKVKTKTVKIFLKNYTIYGRQWYSTISLTLSVT